MKIKQMLRIFAIIITHILLPLGIGYMLLLGIYMTYNAFKDIEDLANRSDVNDLDTLKVQEKQIEASDNADDKKFVEPAKSLEEQFDGLYKSLNVLPLPISLSQVEYYDSELSKLFTKIPKTLIPAFKFIYDDEHDSYDKDNVWVAKMSGYRSLKIVIIRAYFQSGQDVLFLCTFLNNAVVDYLTIYSVGDWEYDGGFGVAETSFLIKNNYEILVKRAHYPNPADRENELDVRQDIYIINDDGKFVKK